jgi:hypothetical protein
LAQRLEGGRQDSQELFLTIKVENWHLELVGLSRQPIFGFSF